MDGRLLGTPDLLHNRYTSMVYRLLRSLAMSRTNIEIDDELIDTVMRQRGFKTKREAVDAGLRTLYVRPATREEFLALEGIGWEGDLDEMRRTDPSVEKWIEEQDREAERANRRRAD